MVIKLFRRHSVLACAAILCLVIVITMVVNLVSRSGTPQKGGTPVSNTSSAVSGPPSVTQASTEEMRAVWVPFMSLDMSREEDKGEKAFQAKFDSIVSGAKECGMNALIVHVRPFGDSLYPSDYFPWSHIVGGTQGVNPGYDPLQYMVEACHKAGLEFHAWVNPLRVQTSGTPSILAENNPYNTWKNDEKKKGWIVETSSGKYYNPAYPEVRRLIADGVKEIVEKYEVDGVQFDDYFYPTEDASFDESAYSAYCETAKKNGTPLSLSEWRKANINALVSLVYSEVKSTRSTAVFGIAPQGNIQNDLKMGADVYSWCSTQGYLDYICPQLYVNFENTVLPFDTAAETWKSIVTNQNIKLYLGLAVYKAGSDADEGTWKKSSDILAKQVLLGRETDCDGFMFYSWDYLNKEETKEEVQNVIKLFR